MLATGFETSFILPGHQDPALTQRKVEAHGFQVFGRGGRSLGEHWGEAGLRTLDSLMSRGFSRTASSSTARRCEPLTHPSCPVHGTRIVWAWLAVWHGRG
eukprot:COSAG05_NODE_479_length_9424_cov_38.098552_8_plen_100_part_00